MIEFVQIVSKICICLLGICFFLKTRKSVSRRTKPLWQMVYFGQKKYKRWKEIEIVVKGVELDENGTTCLVADIPCMKKYVVLYNAFASEIKCNAKVEDEYVLGSEQEWLRVTALEGARRSQGSIPSGGKLDLTIEWRWPFESGGDELDTQIGASASQEKLYVTVFGLDRDVNSAPVVVKSDSVELIKPSLSAVAILLVILFLNGSSVNKWKNRVQRGSDKK